MSSIYICVYRFDSEDGWPHDTGDDPSFRSSNEHRSLGGVLTWGVCRADLRNAIQEKDIVVFFGMKLGIQPAPYRFSGFAAVDRKISQAEIWRKKDFAVYRKYKNLLIRPARSGFEHYEPAFPPTSERKPHKDWLWRIADRRWHRRNSLEQMEASGKVPPDSVQFGKNYVLFRPEGDGTLILASPPIVAEAQQSGEEELWRSDAIARDVYEAVLSKAPRRHLRTRNLQRPHRHIRIRNADAQKWLQILHNLCERHNLTSRHESVGHADVGELILNQPPRGKLSRRGGSC